MRVIVVGAGIVGLATAAVLADAGADVRCLDAGEPMGARSAGGTRVFRLAHGDAGLVDAARRAREDWDAWSARAGRTLVGDEGTIVSGPRVPAWAAAMAGAGAEHEVTGDDLTAIDAGLPGPVAGPVLRDPGGGVLDLRATAAFLTGAVAPERRRVLAVGPDGAVTCEDGTEHADAVVVAAGAGTAELVAPLGVEVPGTLEHHARIAFRPRADLGAAPCHLDGNGAGALASTYQHLTRDGLWAVGGHLPDADTDHALGADEVAHRSRAAVVAHVAARLPGLDPEPVEELRCVPHRGLGDGVHRARAGAVHVVWGDNLAKLAPWIGRTLAEGVLARS